MTNDDFDFENEDVEIVFENLNAFEQQEIRQAHEVLLSSFYRDGLRIRHLSGSENLTDAGLDTSTLPREVVATFPKEWADEH